MAARSESLPDTWGTIPAVPPGWPVPPGFRLVAIPMAAVPVATLPVGFDAWPRSGDGSEAAGDTGSGMANGLPSTPRPGAQDGPGISGPTPRRASWRRRAAAGLLDIVVVGGAYSAATVLAPALGSVFLLAAVVGWCWNVVVRQGRSGASVGKQCLGLRVLGETTGAPIGPARSLVRQCLHLLDALGCLGYLWPLWDPARQTFADKLVGTVVMLG